MPLTDLPFGPAPLYDGGQYPKPGNSAACFMPVKAGAKMRVAQFLSGPSATRMERPLLLLLNGRGEYIEKYYEPIGQILSRGYDVLTLDWRGQGLSSRMLPDRLRGHVDHFDTYLDDLERVLTSVAMVDRRVTQPKMVMGHSMGGALSLLYAARNPQRVKAIALSAPMVGMRVPTHPLFFEIVLRFNLLLGRAGAYPLGGESDPTPNSFDDQRVTRDPDRYASDASFYKIDPDILVKGATNGWLAAACAAVRALHWRSTLKKLSMPVLIQTAVADRLVPTEAHEKYAALLANGSLCAITDAQHELMREIDEVVDAYWRNFDDWRETL
ncbi:MAG: alpha/beta hydrolase [Alphaproteobacteria bacterium]